ncbi:MAG: pyridoxamine 5'-phosphate oxidase [Rhodobacteraceae bacterium]|nr:pyridoxamine 5'-phosphate oxidase [Paracoccaceae bacterium]
MNTPNRTGIFSGDDPFEIAHSWLTEATAVEPNDPNAIALATVDADGLPNVRMVLLKEITENAFVFYTNYNSVKSVEVLGNGKCAFVMHWKSLRRQVRVRGLVEKVDGPEADAYFESRGLQSKLGAWASDQSQPLESRAALIKRVAGISLKHGIHPKRPPFWGGFRISPTEIEFWADGKHRLHDRFKWSRNTFKESWVVKRLNP